VRANTRAPSEARGWLVLEFFVNLNSHSSNTHILPRLITRLSLRRGGVEGLAPSLGLQRTRGPAQVPGRPLVARGLVVLQGLPLSRGLISLGLLVLGGLGSGPGLGAARWRGLGGLRCDGGG